MSLLVRTAAGRFVGGGGGGGGWELMGCAELNLLHDPLQ